MTEFPLPQDSPQWPLYFAATCKQQITDPDRPSVVCLGRAHFDQDIRVLRRAGTKYNWLRIPAEALTFVQQAWMPPELMFQKEYDKYRGAKYDLAWAESSAFFEKVLSKLQMHVNLAAIMAANFDYWIDEGFRLACRKMGVPFLVLMREHLVFPAYHELKGHYYALENYPLKPKVDGVAVAGKTTRDVLVGCKVFAPSRIQVTGLPRMDPWIPTLATHETPPERSIVLLTYTDSSYGGGDTFKEVLEALVAAAQRHQNAGMKFIIKCKSDEDQAILEDMLSAYPGHRLTISRDSVFSVVSTASVVIGLNSLAMIEVLLSKARILVPQWGGARTEREYQYFWRDDPNHRAAVHFLNSIDECVAEVDAAASEDYRAPDMEPRIKLIQELMDFDLSIPAAGKVEDFVDHYVREVAARRAP